MPISFACSCGKRLKVADNLAGKKVKCPGCQQVALVPAEDGAAAPAKPSKPAASAKPNPGIKPAAAKDKTAPAQPIPPAKSKPSAPAPKRPAPVDDEPDLSDLFGDDEPAAPPKPAPKKKPGKPVDDEDEGGGFGLDDDMPPPAPASKKKPAKPMEDDDEGGGFGLDDDDEAPPPPPARKGKKPIMDEDDDIPPEDEDDDDMPRAKGKKGKTPPKKKSSSLLLLILLLVLVLAGGGGAYWWFFMRGPAQVVDNKKGPVDPNKNKGDGEQKPPPPTEVKAAPTDTAAVLSIRVKDWWEGKSAKALAETEQVKTGLAFLENLGIAPLDIERVDVFFFPPKKPKDPPAFLARILPTRSLDVDKLKAGLPKGTREVTVDDKAYYQVSPSDPTVLHFSENLIVAATTPYMKDFLADKMKFDNHNFDADLEKGKTRHFVLAGTPKALPADTMKFAEAQLKAAKELDSVTIFGQDEETLQLEVTIKLADEAKAKEVLADLEGLLGVGKDLVDKLAASPDAKRPLEKKLLELAKDALDKLKLTSKDDALTVEATLPNLAELAPILMELQESKPKKVEKKVENKSDTSSSMEQINRFKNIAIAFHAYNDTYKKLPKVKSGLSWRVALLPFVDEFELFKEFKQDEPWDSEHNMKLLDKIPAVYRPLSKPAAKEGDTFVQVFTGPNTPWKDDKVQPSIPRTYTDGTSNTILFVEAARPVPWTKPEDLVVDPKAPLPKLGQLQKDGFFMALADASVHFVLHKKVADEKVLRALIDPQDGITVPGDLFGTPDDTEPKTKVNDKDNGKAATIDDLPPKVQQTLYLRMLGLAMHSYHDAYKKMPKAKAGLSWRVAILPFVEEGKLYNQFKQDEPWDSEHNIKLLPKIPKIYRPLSGAKVQEGGTFFQVFTGPYTPWGDDKKPVGLAQTFSDGTSNSFLIVEAANDVPWTKPEDLAIDPRVPLPKLGNLDKVGFFVVMADGSTLFVPHKALDEKTLRMLIDPADGGVLPPAWEKFVDSQRKPPPPSSTETSPKTSPPVPRPKVEDKQDPKEAPPPPPKVNDKKLDPKEAVKALEKLEAFAAPVDGGWSVDVALATDADAAMRLVPSLGKIRRLRLGEKATDAHLAQVKDFPDLRVLDISFARGVTDAGMKHLVELPLTELSLVHVEGVTPVGLAPVATMLELETLNLGKVPVGKGPKALLAPLLRLQHLDLLACELTDESLADLAGLTDLRDLKLDGNPGIKGPGLRHLAELTKLERLMCENTDVDDSGLLHLANLTNLRAVFLRNTKITDAGLAAMEKWARIEFLDVAGTRIKGSGFRHFAGITSLREVELGHLTDLTGDGLEHLAGCKDLTALNLAFTGVTDGGLAKIKKLTQLTSLNLPVYGNPTAFPFWRDPHPERFSDRGLKHVGEMANLEVLLFSGSGVTDAGLAHLAGMKSLRILNMGNVPNIKGPGIHHLKALPMLEFVRIPRAAIAEPIVAEFKKAMLKAQVQVD